MRRSALGFAIVSLALPMDAAAQQVSLMAGRAEYDLSGVHTSNVWAGRAAGGVRSFLLAEASVSYIHTRQQFGRSDLWLPEAQLQAQLVRGAFAPYLGAGIGMAIDAPEDDTLETDTDLMTSVAAGARVELTERIGVRVEGRLQGIEIDWVGTVAGLTAGLVVGL